MEKVKNYALLHATIVLFSLTSVFSKFASGFYNDGGLSSPFLYLFIFRMLATCGIYALVWQRVIKKFDLNVAYANRTVYIVWSQVWAVLIFHENLSVNNIIGIVILFIGVLVVTTHDE